MFSSNRSVFYSFADWRARRNWINKDSTREIWCLHENSGSVPMEKFPVCCIFAREMPAVSRERVFAATKNFPRRRRCVSELFINIFSHLLTVCTCVSVARQRKLWEQRGGRGKCAFFQIAVIFQFVSEQFSYCHPISCHFGSQNVLHNTKEENCHQYALSIIGSDFLGPPHLYFTMIIAIFYIENQLTREMENDKCQCCVCTPARHTYVFV